MKIRTSARFDKRYAEAPLRIQGLIDKQVQFLAVNLRHPSLHSKKYDEVRGIWQARVNGGWLYYFTVEGDTYHLITVRSHPK